MHKLNSQKDYTSFGGSYQVSLPFNLEFQIGKDDPVRLLRHCIGGMDITALEKTYQRINRNLASPRQMLAIIVYAGMNHIFSSRRIELACRRDINFMYLLEGKPVPDHTTIARFRSKHLASCIKELFAQMDFMLEDMGAISLLDIFIDGTKIESVANKYKFVWKKSVQKNQAKLMEKMPDFVDKVKEDFSVSLSHGKDIHLHHLKKLRRKLKVRQKEQGIQFVHGIGKRKTSLQKTMEQLEKAETRENPKLNRNVQTCMSILELAAASAGAEAFSHDPFRGQPGLSGISADPCGAEAGPGGLPGGRPGVYLRHAPGHGGGGSDPLPGRGLHPGGADLYG